jgi:hypothetical protein
VQDSE